MLVADTPMWLETLYSVRDQLRRQLLSDADQFYQDHLFVARFPGDTYQQKYEDVHGQELAESIRKLDKMILALEVNDEQ